MKKGLLITGALLWGVFLSACSNENTNDVTTEEETKNEQTTINEKDQVENKEEQQETNHSSSVIAKHDFYEKFDGQVEHIHGLGYMANQHAIFFAAHDGLKVYENGNWYKTKGQNNDYMGFNAVDKGFYTSGHPGEGVDLPNPLGLKRSFDYGQTFEDLGMEGESDFHVMGVGYFNHTVYLLNEMKNSKIGAGLYVSKDEGQNWEKIKAENLGEKIFSLAVHPTKSEIVAAAGEKGIFLSKDGGQTFELLTENKQGTAVFFSEDTLWYGTYEKSPMLVKYSIESGEEEEVTLPKMEQDAVMYIAQNPQKESEIVFATFKNHIYLSEDGGNTWKQLVKEGIIQTFGS